MNYQPELGQALFAPSSVREYDTPGYVTAGIDALDELINEHTYGVRPVQHEYGTYPDTSMYATSNSGQIHELPEGAPFSMRAFDWSDPDEYDPNFHHFESGFQAFWYKHSHRGESCNQDISSKAWRTIQRECEDWVLAQPPAYRVLITGSRDYAPECFELGRPNRKGKQYKQLRDDFMAVPSEGRDKMRAALKEARQHAGDAHMVIVNGSAMGADWLARGMSWEADNCHSEDHPALWNRTDDGKYDRAAGFKRNQRMVESGVDVCFAFFKEGAGNRGTQHCANLAREAGIQVVEVWS